jgi:hypothetical protein
VLAFLCVELLEDRFDRRCGEHAIDQRRVPHKLALPGIAVKPIEQLVDWMVVTQRVFDHAEMR